MVREMEIGARNYSTMVVCYTIRTSGQLFLETQSPSRGLRKGGRVKLRL